MYSILFSLYSKSICILIFLLDLGERGRVIAEELGTISKPGDIPKNLGKIVHLCHTKRRKEKRHPRIVALDCRGLRAAAASVFGHTTLNAPNLA